MQVKNLARNSIKVEDICRECFCRSLGISDHKLRRVCHMVKNGEVDDGNLEPIEAFNVNKKRLELQRMF